MRMTARPERASSSMIWCTSALAPTSMPRVGSSRISTVGSVLSHLASIVFCWLPPDSSPTGCAKPGCADLELCAELLGGVALGGAVEQAQSGGVAAQCRQRDVRSDRLRHRQADVPAILGEIRDAVLERDTRAGDARRARPSISIVPVSAGAIPNSARRDVGATGTDETGESRAPRPCGDRRRRRRTCRCGRGRERAGPSRRASCSPRAK